MVPERPERPKPEGEGGERGGGGSWGGASARRGGALGRTSGVPRGQVFVTHESVPSSHDQFYFCPMTGVGSFVTRHVWSPLLCARHASSHDMRGFCCCREMLRECVCGRAPVDVRPCVVVRLNVLWRGVGFRIVTQNFA